MSKTNISFNGTEYPVETSTISSFSTNLKSHLSTTMNGVGSVINLGGESYNIDSTKLTDATNAFVSHLENVAGDGFKVSVGGVEYSVDLNKMDDAIIDLHDVFNNIRAQIKSLVPGLYQTGAIDMYKEQGEDAIADMLITSWEDLIANGDVVVIDGVIADVAASSNDFNGDLLLPCDGSIHTIGEESFAYCFYLTGIIIPDSVTNIVFNAFNSCSRITNVIFGENSQLTSIGENAFASCGRLEEIEIPDSVTTIDWLPFAGCTNLTTITILSEIPPACGELFDEGDGIPEIRVPAGSVDVYKEAEGWSSYASKIVAID